MTAESKARATSRADRVLLEEKERECTVGGRNNRTSTCRGRNTRNIRIGQPHEDVGRQDLHLIRTLQETGISLLMDSLKRCEETSFAEDLVGLYTSFRRSISF
jgi:hypothetical protein